MNVIVICIDTLRWDHLGCYGAGTGARTPHIDAYATRAVRFTQAYCGSFPTVPMRVDAYTGDVNWPRYGWKSPDADQAALPQVLREHGYLTGFVLDTQNNIYAGLHRYYDSVEVISKPPTNTCRPEDVTFPFPRENCRQNGVLYARDMADTAHYRHECDWFVAQTMLRACAWLEDHAGREPFFLWVDTFEPHEVWRAPAHYIALYSRGYEGIDYSYPNYGRADIYRPHELARLRARYMAEVTLTDRWVGHLFEQIDLMGLFADTTVILTSDHGMYLGEHNLVGKHTVEADDPWPLLDEVIRVPLLVWTPGIRPGVVDALVEPADLMPTVLELCGVTPHAPYGRSWLPVLRGEQTHRAAVFSSCYSWDGPGRIPYLRSQVTVTTPEWTLSAAPPPLPTRLFHRRTDPAQEKECAAQYPEVVRQLRQMLADFMCQRGAHPDYIRTYAGVEPSMRRSIRDAL
jgi:arylsulfatase A-like enzyme